MILFGSRNYGRSNVLSSYSTCGNCGVFGKLSSFDTSCMGHIYWIPLIPLGRRRITDMCPLCKTGRQMGLREYNNMKSKALSHAVTSMKSEPDNPGVAVSSLQTFMAYGDRQSLQSLAPVLGEKHVTDATVQHMVGEAFEYLGDLERSVEYYRRALHIDQSPTYSEKLAMALIRTGDPGEAEKQLAHIWELKDKTKIGYLYFLVEGYRHYGRHTDALRTLVKIEEIDPTAAEDEVHSRYRESSEELASLGTPILSASLSSPSGMQDERAGTPLWAPLLVPIILVMLAIGIYTFHGIKKGVARDVWLVSGVTESYKVSINEVSYVLEPMQTKKIQLPEGVWKIHVRGLRMPTSEETIRYTTPFWSRALNDDTVVLNPDHQALLVRETVVYGEVSSDSDTSSYELFVGQSMYILDDIEYPFTDLPETIQLSSGSKRVYKDRVYVYDGPMLTKDRLGFVLSHVQNVRQMTDFLKWRSLFSPDDGNTVRTYATIAAGQPENDVLAFLRNGLQLRPMLIDWHRIYQGLMGRLQPDFDLEAEYRVTVEQEPENAVAKYLLGRVVQDRVEAETLFRASDSLPNATGYGYNAIAHLRLCSGQFVTALESSRTALSLNSKPTQFQANFEIGLLATENFQELLDRVRENKKLADMDVVSVAHEAKLLTLLHKPDEAERRVQTYWESLQSTEPDENLPALRAYMGLPIHYVQGDISAYFQGMEAAGMPRVAFEEAVEDGNLKVARDYLDAQSDTSWQGRALLYAVAEKAGASTEAASFLQQVIDALASGGTDERGVANLFLAEGQMLVPEQLENAIFLPADKRILALALGFRHPNLRDFCFGVARLHNFDPVFPYHLVKRMAGSGRE